MTPSPFRRPSKPLNANMDVVPYIDVMLVLLVIFMVTAPMLTTGVDVDLPKEQTRNLETGIQLPVIVSMDEAGKLFVSYDNPGATTTDGTATADTQVDMPVSHEELIDKLAQLQRHNQAVNSQDAQDLQVMVNADKNNDYGQVMTLMADIQKAGIQKVGLLTGSPSPDAKP